MKVKVLSLLVPALLVAGAANAAEVYNKDGNKLDLYGKVDGLHYFSDNKSERRRPDLCTSWFQRRNSGY